MIDKDGKDREVITEEKRKCPRCKSIMITDGSQYQCVTCESSVIDHDGLGDKFEEK